MNDRLRSRHEVAAREPLRLRNLRLPFAVRLTARRGAHRLSSDRRSGILSEGASLVLPVYHALHYEGATIVDVRAGHELHLSIYDQTPEAASGGDANTAAARRCTDADPALTTRLARAVFLNPAADWTPCGAAAHVGMTIGALKTQLFREGSALTATVREQRLMRALLELLTPPPAWGRDMGHLAVQVGLTPHARLDEIFLRHFGCCAAQLARLSWCPALTWSIAPTLHLIH